MFRFNLLRISFLQFKPSRLRFLFVLFVALIGFSFSTFAQQATIVGTVTDPSGAVVPNVNVTITNTDTGLAVCYPTNDAGQYRGAQIFRSATIHQGRSQGIQGFGTKKRRAERRRPHSRGFQMLLGAAKETVSVEANAVRVQTDTVSAVNRHHCEAAL